MVTKELATPAAMPARIYAVGDVHGQLAQLRAVHALIAADLADSPASPALLVHLGDYIDRGPDSAGCLELLAAGSPVPGVPCCNLMGNHEQMLLDAMAGTGDAAIWLENGGSATLRSWNIDPRSDPTSWLGLIPPHHLAFLRGLELGRQVGPYLFVHAGVRPGIRLAMQSAGDLLWIRDEFLFWTGTMLPDAPHLRVVHGHTPTEAPDLRPNRLGIDTNAARGGRLTCAALASDSVYFLQA